MAPNSASLLFSTPSTRKSAVQAVVFCLKRQTTGHLEHSGKCTMSPTPPVYVCKIEHLRLPLSFGWMCALPESERAEMGSADSVPTSLLIFSWACPLFSSNYLPNAPCVTIQCTLLPVEHILLQVMVKASISSFHLTYFILVTFFRDI